MCNSSAGDSRHDPRLLERLCLPPTVDIVVWQGCRIVGLGAVGAGEADRIDADTLLAPRAFPALMESKPEL